MQQYRVKAKNGVGYGPYSVVYDVYADKVPQFMNMAQHDYLANHINPYWIYLTWEALIETQWDKTGGDKPVEYVIEWNNMIGISDPSISQNWQIISSQQAI